jgi:hypothetical protein
MITAVVVVRIPVSEPGQTLSHHFTPHPFSPPLSLPRPPPALTQPSLHDEGGQKCKRPIGRGTTTSCTHAQRGSTMFLPYFVRSARHRVGRACMHVCMYSMNVLYVRMCFGPALASSCPLARYSTEYIPSIGDTNEVRGRCAGAVENLDTTDIVAVLTLIGAVAVVPA